MGSIVNNRFQKYSRQCQKEAEHPYKAMISRSIEINEGPDIVDGGKG